MIGADAFAIRTLAPDDIDAGVHLHAATLDGVMNRLGHRFLTVFHEAALQHPSTRAFVAAGTDGRLAGFAVATLDAPSFHRALRRRLFPALLRAVAAPQRWTLGWRMARAVVAERAPRPVMTAELLLLSVDPSARRQGIARRLLEVVEGEFRRHDVDRYRVGVRSHLEESRRAYESLGFVLEQRMPVLRMPMTYLVRHLS